MCIETPVSYRIHKWLTVVLVADIPFKLNPYMKVSNLRAESTCIIIIIGLSNRSSLAKRSKEYSGYSSSLLAPCIAVYKL